MPSAREAYDMAWNMSYHFSYKAVGIRNKRYMELAKRVKGGLEAPRVTSSNLQADDQDDAKDEPLSTASIWIQLSPHA